MFQECKKYYIVKRIFEFLEILNLHVGKILIQKVVVIDGYLETTQVNGSSGMVV